MTRDDIDMCEYLRIWGPPEAAARIEALSAEVEQNAAIAIRALERATLAEEWRDHDKTRAEAAEAKIAKGIAECDRFVGPVSRSQFVNGQATAAQQIRAALGGSNG
jgi:hypothetical protein